MKSVLSDPTLSLHHMHCHLFVIVPTSFCLIPIPKVIRVHCLFACLLRRTAHGRTPPLVLLPLREWQIIFAFKFSSCQPRVSIWTSTILHFFASLQVDVSLISKEASRDLLNAVVSHWQAYLQERMTAWRCLYFSDHGIFSAQGGNMTTTSTETRTSLLSGLQRKSWRRWRPSSFYLPYPSIRQAPTLMSWAIQTLPNHASGYFFHFVHWHVRLHNLFRF